MSSYFAPFDPADPFNAMADKHRQRLLGVIIRALRESKVDGLNAAVVGSMVAIAQVCVSSGVPPEKLRAHLGELMDFAVAQATNGAVVSPEFLVKHGVGGSA